MSITITGKLNKPANKFDAGDYTGFGVRLGVQYYDRKTKQKEWTNYSAVLFASQPAKIKYYEDVLIEGAVVEVSGQKARIDTYEDKHTIELLEASLGFAFTGEQSSLQQSNANNVNQQQFPDANDGFDDDIGF